MNPSLLSDTVLQSPNGVDQTQMVDDAQDIDDPRDKIRKVCNKLGITVSTATCWVTGKCTTVTNVQILPESTNNKTMRRLQLDPEFKHDVDAVPSNFMILDEHLKYAFDTMQISFSPVDLLHTDILRLKVWDPSCRDDPIEAGTVAERQRDILNHGRELRTIRDYEGFPLNVPASWRVSKTALSYHTLCCYMYQKYKRSKSIDVDEPADFTSCSRGRDRVRRLLAEIFHSSIRADNHHDNHHSGDSDATYEDASAVGEAACNSRSGAALRSLRKRCLVM